MPNLIQRPFILTHNVNDDPKQLIPAIRRRTEELKAKLDLDGPFILQVPREWMDNLFEPYSTVGVASLLINRILEEKISGIEFMRHDKLFTLVWRLPDIRKRV